MRIKRMITGTLALGLCLGAMTLMPVPARADNIHIVLDPGHGGDQSGATNDEHGVAEKTVNLKIGQYLKEALMAYDGVSVSLTRDSDATLDLAERAEQAVDEGADVFISLHNNALGDIADYHSGGTVLVPQGTYNQEMAQTSQELGACIMYELSAHGIEDRGLLERITQNGETYPNGATADYYGLIRRGVLNDVPSVIIEHCFLDDASDYEKFLSTEDKLKELAEADARGIARYYQLPLKETGEVLKPLKNEKTQIVMVISEYAKDNIYMPMTYFPSDETEIEEETFEEDSDEGEETSGEAEATAAFTHPETTAAAETEAETEEETEEAAAGGIDIHEFRKGMLIGSGIGALVGIVFGILLATLFVLARRGRGSGRSGRGGEDRKEDPAGYMGRPTGTPFEQPRFEQPGGYPEDSYRNSPTSDHVYTEQESVGRRTNRRTRDNQRRR